MDDYDSKPLWKKAGLCVASFFSFGIYTMGLWRIWEMLDVFKNAPHWVREIYATVLWGLMFAFLACLGYAMSVDDYLWKERETIKSIFSAISIAVYGIGIERVVRAISGNHSSILKVIFFFCALANLVYIAHGIAVDRQRLIYESGYKEGYWDILRQQAEEQEQKEEERQ